MRGLYKTIFTLIIFVASTCYVAYTNEFQPELSADDPIEYDQSTKELIATGHARIVHEKFFMQADQINFHKDDSQIDAIGNIQINQSPFRMVSEESYYNLQSKNISLNHFRFGKTNFFMKGERLEGDENTFIVKEPTIFFHEPNLFAPNVYTAKVKYIADAERIKGSHAFFRVGKVPFFYIPYYSVTSHSSPLRVKTEVGHESNRYGFYIRNTIFVPAFEHTRVGALLDYYEERGPLAGPAFEYNQKTDWTYVDSNFKSGFIHDQGDDLAPGLNKNRNFILWTHKQDIYDSITITNNLSWWSDKDALRDFRPSYFNQNQQPDNFIEGTYSENDIIASVIVRHRPNDFQFITERLPEVAFNLTPIPLFESSAYQQLDAKFSKLRKKPLDGTANQELQRMSLYYGLSNPIYLHEALTFTPVIGGLVSRYSDTEGAVKQDGSFARSIGQLGFDLESKFFGKWQYSNEIWDIYDFKHVGRPIIQYRYITADSKNLDEIPAIDTTVFSKEIESIDLAERRDLDTFTELHLVRFALLNVLQTNTNSYGARSLIDLNFYQDYRFSKQVPQKSLSNFTTEFGFHPASWISFSMIARHELKSFTLNELSTTTTIRDADLWSLSFSTYALQRNIDQYRISGTYRLTEDLTSFASITYDSRLDSFIYQQYGLTSYMKNTWKIDYYVTFTEKAQRERDTAYRVRITLLNM